MRKAHHEERERWGEGWGVVVGKLNSFCLNCGWKMRAMGSHRCMRANVWQGGEAVDDLPHTATAALPLVLLSTWSQLLLSHCHLLLHVGDLLLGPSTVLLEEQHKRGEMRGGSCEKQETLMLNKQLPALWCPGFQHLFVNLTPKLFHWYLSNFCILQCNE